MDIPYDHNKSPHSVRGAAAALAVLFGAQPPASFLDVGCGTGTWVRAAIDGGVGEVFGVDGIDIPQDRLLIPRQHFAAVDLSRPFRLARRYQFVACLEVAEHLPQASAADLIASLAEHGDRILFSAACPGQPGQHHVNCQWPQYWQSLFNQKQFRCDDVIRWRLWDESAIEPWYRQNIFVAERDPVNAGKERRIPAVIHPDMRRILMSPLNYLPPRMAEGVRFARRSLQAMVRRE